MNTLCTNSVCTNSVSTNSINAISRCASAASISASSKLNIVDAPARKSASTVVKSGAVNLLSAIKEYVVRKYSQRIDRQAFHHLLALDDSLLKDIGVTRGDITWASNLPLSVDAAAEIEKIARRR